VGEDSIHEITQSLTTNCSGKGKPMRFCGIALFAARASRYRTWSDSDRMLALNDGLKARLIKRLNVAAGRSVIKLHLSVSIRD
jgi:hypothetical protein